MMRVLSDHPIIRSSEVLERWAEVQDILKLTKEGSRARTVVQRDVMSWGYPQSSIFLGFSPYKHHVFWGIPMAGNPHAKLVGTNRTEDFVGFQAPTVIFVGDPTVDVL